MPQRTTVNQTVDWRCVAHSEEEEDAYDGIVPTTTLSVGDLVATPSSNIVHTAGGAMWKAGGLLSLATLVTSCLMAL